VKLLFDANLSPALVVALQAEYPGISHVRDVGLGPASDAQI
jgi:predicted nuclease of predicted toxin-antitoxin system